MRTDKVLVGIVAAIVLAYCSMSAIEAATGTYAATGTSQGTVTVTQYIDITTPATIAFGSVAPGASDSAATGNPYTISVNSNTNIDTNMTLKGDQYFNWTTLPYANHYFAIGGLTYFNANAVGSSVAITTSGTTDTDRTTLGYGPITAPSGGSQVDKNLYAWIDIPTGQYAAAYNTTVYVNVTAIV